VLVGYSWGAAVTAMADPAALVAQVLVAPPVSLLDGTIPSGPLTLLLVPAHDQYGPPDDVRRLVEGWPATTLEVVEGTDHFLVGAIAKIADRAVTWATSQL
jgi:pimeloyl-ACP methyl ester carboxylesterase